MSDTLLIPKQDLSMVQICLVAELDKVLVRELNDWVANPLGPGQTSALQIKKQKHTTVQFW